MISIIFPVYNVDKYLEASLKSCLCQTYREIEIVAVNDGSTDNSLNILSKYAKQDSRIKIISQTNQGVAAARRKGILESSGEYVMFVDSDDILPVNSLEILYSNICVHNADISIGNHIECSGGKRYKERYHFPKDLFLKPEHYLDLILNQRMQWGLCAKLYKRELFDNLIIVPKLRLGEDAALLVQVIINSQTIVLTDRNVYFYEQHAGSAVHAYAVSYVADIYKFRVWIVDFLQKKRYPNEYYLKKFLVDGYLECLLHGGYQFLTKSDYLKIFCFYKEVQEDLPLWKKTVFLTCTIPVIGNLVIKGLWQLRKFKLFLKH